MPAPLGDDPSLLPLSAKASSSTSTTDRPGTVTLLAASPSSVAVIVTIVAEMTCISTPIATPVRLGKKHQEQWSASSGHSYCAIADCYSGLLSLYHPFPHGRLTESVLCSRCQIHAKTNIPCGFLKQSINKAFNNPLFRAILTAPRFTPPCPHGKSDLIFKRW